MLQEKLSVCNSNKIRSYNNDRQQTKLSQTPFLNFLTTCLVTRSRNSFGISPPLQ